MEHSFDTSIAKEYGILEAVILNHLRFWIEHNKKNNINFHDGYYWTFNSLKAFQGLFEYASKGQIERALNHLKDEGLIIVGNYNTAAFDRTVWYALTEKGENTFPKREMHFSNSGNAFPENEKPIPDINTDINIIKERNNINVISKEKATEEPKKKEGFVKPTLEEVQAYINEQRFIVNAETFIDYYESNGWKVGKNPMKDWKAAVRTWEQKEKEKRNRYGNQSNSKPYVREEQEFGVGNGEELPF